MRKWLECHLVYRPEAGIRCYTAEFVDASGRPHKAKVSSEVVYSENGVLQPPLCPYSSPGYVQIEIEVQGHDKCAVFFPGIRDSTFVVPLKNLDFTPPKPRTTMLILRKKNHG